MCVIPDLDPLVLKPLDLVMYKCLILMRVADEDVRFIAFVGWRRLLQRPSPRYVFISVLHQGVCLKLAEPGRSQAAFYGISMTAYGQIVDGAALAAPLLVSDLNLFRDL